MAPLGYLRPQGKTENISTYSSIFVSIIGYTKPVIATRHQAYFLLSRRNHSGRIWLRRHAITEGDKRVKLSSDHIRRSRWSHGEGKAV